MTADALSADDTRLAGVTVEDNGLMSTIATRHLAASATDAALAIYLGVDDGIAIELAGLCEHGNPLADEVNKVVNAPFRHVAAKAENEVIDDAVAVLHDGGTHLYVTASELDELQCVAPCLNATNATEVGTAEDIDLRHLKDVAQGDRLDSTAGIARDGATIGDIGTGIHGDRLDGVNGRNSIGTA